MDRAIPVADAVEKNAEIPSETVGIAPPEQTIINTTIIAEIDPTITVTLDGETLESTEVRRADNGGLYVNAMPIFAALENTVDYDKTKKALIVRRSQDNVVMELYTDTGVVKANGKSLGKLKHFGEVAKDRYILTPNAIAVLSGAAGTYRKDTNKFEFKLDPRLRVATGFDVFVNDLSLGNLNPAPKSIGSVLLLPLLPIAEELGHDVQVLDGKNEVRVRRVQDSAVLTLNLDTGLIKLRDRPYGISKDVTYIDDINLLLPVSAIEALTGTHVTVSGGENRIDIDLDNRLTNTVKPQDSVEEIAKNTPFTAESLSFSAGPDVINQAEFNFRQGRINGRIRYEIPDLPTSVKELQPSWLSVDFAHMNGITGSIGDYAADHRELDGVGLRRIRGVSAVKTTEKGRWALAAGLPNTGAKRITERQSRQTFSGFAAGVRYASRKGWEAGGAVKVDTLTDDQMAVLSAISGRLGRIKDKKLNWDVRADVGTFNGPAREKAVDIAIISGAQYEVSPSVTFDVNAEYIGAEFLRSNLDVEDREDNITEVLADDEAQVEEKSLIPDPRRRGADEALLSTSLRYTSSTSFGPLDSPAISARAQYRETGLLTGKDIGSQMTNLGANFGAQIKATGVDISIDASQYDLNSASGDSDERGWQYGVRAQRRFELANVQASYQKSHRSGLGTNEAAVATVSGRTFNVPLPKSARLGVSPSVSASWNGDNTSFRGGVIANLNSGRMLGKKTSLSASLGILQSAGGLNSSRTDKFLSVSLSRDVRIGKNMALGLAYRNDLNGNQRIGMQLEGRFQFNETRKYKSTQDGRGVLKGRVFLDENRNGHKDENERAIPRALVKLRNSHLALRTDSAGFFTIQNIKEGLYELYISDNSLPLGYALADSFVGRATISDGHITDIQMPVVQRGQIRGFTFVDANGDGEFTNGEERVEGLKLLLTAKGSDADPETAIATSFGQFAFDDLPANEYEITVKVGKKARYIGIKPVTLNLSDAPNLMARVQIPLKPVEAIQLADRSSTDPPLDDENTLVSAREGPAPP